MQRQSVAHPVAALLGLLMATLAACLPAQADILRLISGQRYYGQVIQRDSDAIVFRVVAGPGPATIRQFPSALVAELSQTQTQAAETASQALTPGEHMILEALELLDDGEPGRALSAFEYAVHTQDARVLEQASELTSVRVGQRLDRLMARLRVEVAERERGDLSRLRYATPLEAEALVELLHLRLAALWSAEHDGRTLAAWSAAPNEYAALQPGATALVEDARRATALIRFILRFMPRDPGDRPQRAALAARERRLVQLATRISALPGFTALSAGSATAQNDPTLAEAERIEADLRATELEIERLRAAASQPASEEPDEAGENPPAASRPAPRQKRP